jgi:transposase
MARVTSLQERATIDQMAQLGYTDRQISVEVGWTKGTVRKWRRRAQQQGHQGLALKMGRPVTGALSSYPDLVRDTLREWRLAHPGWGPKTLRTELAMDERFQGQGLPDPSSIARFLKEQDLPRPYQRHSELPQLRTGTASMPHEEWEMDARGYQSVPDVGVIALINVNDVFSRVKLLSYPCLLGKKRASRHPTTEDYQLVLRLAFTEWGLPDRLAVDHDSVFYDNTCPSPFPTRFHLWLLALGVPLTFGRKGRPVDQGMTERSHQTWYHQVLEGQAFSSWQALWQALTQRRMVLNEHLPCATLGDVPPLMACPEARRPRRFYRPEWEKELLDLARVYDYLAQGHWFRKGSNIGTVSLGGNVYYLGKHWQRQEVEIIFDLQDQHLVFRTADGQQTKRLVLQGLTAGDLMAELEPLAGFDSFQLMLPFSWEEFRVSRLSETFGITT